MWPFVSYYAVHFQKNKNKNMGIIEIHNFVPRTRLDPLCLLQYPFFPHPAPSFSARHHSPAQCTAALFSTSSCSSGQKSCLRQSYWPFSLPVSYSPFAPFSSPPPWASSWATCFSFSLVFFCRCVFVLFPAASCNSFFSSSSSIFPRLLSVPPSREERE